MYMKSLQLLNASQDDRFDDTKRGNLNLTNGVDRKKLKNEKNVHTGKCSLCNVELSDHISLLLIKSANSKLLRHRKGKTQFPD